MGGLGSGRPYRGKRTVDSCRSLDVNRLRKAGALTPRYIGVWNWSRNGQKVAAIGLIGSEGRIVLSYRVSVYGGESEDINEPVRVVWLACHFGGARPYFICPGVVDGQPCQRRVAKLYAGGRYFCCRCCYRLSYASQSEGRNDRARRRADKIRARLGADPDICFPDRPKGMWQTTYERLISQIAVAEDLADERLIRVAAKLKAAHEKRLKKKRTRAEGARSPSARSRGRAAQQC